MQKPILLIAGCRRYREYLDAAIKRMSRPEWEVIGVIGSTTDEPSFDLETRILSVPNPDTYEALPAKLHAAYCWIAKERPGAPGIFKTDDDIVFELNDLVKAVLAQQAVPYWGVTRSVCQSAPIHSNRIAMRFDNKDLRPSHQAAVYCFGAGYWLSAATWPAIVAATDDYANSCLEDVCTGFVMNRAGITPALLRISCWEMIRGPELLALK